MTGINRGTTLGMAVLALALGGSASAQESLDAGKTGAQLFASDCALCHKSPLGLAKSGSVFGLSGFLKQHYTASQQSANVVAKYLESLPDAPASAKHPVTAKRTAKGDDKAKPDDKKPGAAKPGEIKPGDAKSPAKPTDSKTAEPKADEPKPTEPKVEAAPAAKPEDKPETKPEKPEKPE
jgi:mono/diheme cytochrome c family protein